MRLVQAQIGIQIGHARILPRLGQHLINFFLQLGIAAGLNHELHCRIAETLAERRWIDREGQHARQAAKHLRRQFLGDSLLLALALLPGLEAHKGQRAVDRIGLFQAGRHKGKIRAHLGNTLIELFQLPDIPVGVVESRAFRSNDHADDGAAILQRRQFRFQLQEQPGRAGAAAQEQQHHQPAPAQGPQQRMAIALVHGQEKALADPEQPAVSRFMAQQL